jgi:hypothetical protein
VNGRGIFLSRIRAANELLLGGKPLLPIGIIKLQYARRVGE